MKKITYLSILMLFVGILTSCDAVSSLTKAANPMDELSTYEKALSKVRDNIDASKFKVYKLNFIEGDELSNDLAIASVNFINEQGMAFDQGYLSTGKVTDLKEDIGFSTRDGNYETIRGVDLAAIDPAKMVANIEAAKKMLPEGCTFKSVSMYRFEEKLGKGTIRESFDLCFIEDGKETETVGGKTTYLYYTTTFIVQPDGSVVADN